MRQHRRYRWRKIRRDKRSDATHLRSLVAQQAGELATLRTLAEQIADAVRQLADEQQSLIRALWRIQGSIARAEQEVRPDGG